VDLPGVSGSSRATFAIPQTIRFLEQHIANSGHVNALDVLSLRLPRQAAGSGFMAAGTQVALRERRRGMHGVL
jgi:hypothetical protein